MKHYTIVHIVILIKVPQLLMILGLHCLQQVQLKPKILKIKISQCN